jgi:hypothetical protein
MVEPSATAAKSTVPMSDSIRVSIRPRHELQKAPIKIGKASLSRFLDSCKNA